MTRFRAWLAIWLLVALSLTAIGRAQTTPNPEALWTEATQLYQRSTHVHAGTQEVITQVLNLSYDVLSTEAQTLKTTRGPDGQLRTVAPARGGMFRAGLQGGGAVNQPSTNAQSSTESPQTSRGGGGPPPGFSRPQGTPVDLPLARSVFADQRDLTLYATGVTRSIYGHHTQEITFEAADVSGKAYFDLETGFPVRVIAHWKSTQNEGQDTQIDTLYHMTPEGFLVLKLTMQEQQTYKSLQSRLLRRPETLRVIRHFSDYVVASQP